jgi:hypothetical protein
LVEELGVCFGSLLINALLVLSPVFGAFFRTAGILPSPISTDQNEVIFWGTLDN